MPIYETGKCETCGEESDLLLPMLLRNKCDGTLRIAVICPKCRNWFDADGEEVYDEID